MIKRFIDIGVATTGLLLTLPLLAPAALLIWLQDFRNPFYVPTRVGKGGHSFRMFKLRSMVADADRAGVDSTSSLDPRITTVGKIVRWLKLDELPQLLNVLLGDMSLVGPRPNIDRETRLYTEVERRLLEAQPGITDISSIVFSDLNFILAHSKNPNLDYNQLVRPWKSRLALFYIEKSSIRLDLEILLLTVLGMVARKWALQRLSNTICKLGANTSLAKLVLRDHVLIPVAPPGRDTVVNAEEVER